MDNHKDPRIFCRLCGVENTESNKLDFCETIPEVQRKILFCLALPVSENDPLPKVVCLDCKLKLELFYNFKLKSHETKDSLERYFNSQSTSGPSTTSYSTAQVTKDHHYPTQLVVPSVNPDNVKVKVEGDQLTSLIKVEETSIQEPIKHIPPNQPSGSTVSFAPLYQQGSGTITLTPLYHYPRKVEPSVSSTSFFGDYGKPHELSSDGKQVKEKPFSCTVCNKTFATKNYVKIHVDKKHGLPQEKRRHYKCNICNAGFTNFEWLNFHIFSHSGDVELPYECEICQKRYKSKEGYKAHMLMHSGVKKYSCDFCDKDFAMKSSLISHRRNHTNEKPFECEICFEKFKHRASLTHHLKRPCYRKNNGNT